MSAKMFTSHTTGPVCLHTYLPDRVDLRIMVEDRARADITVTTTDVLGPSARTVENARFSQYDGEILLSVPRGNDDWRLIVEARLPLGSTAS